MLTYQFQRRHLAVAEGQQLVFPARVEVEFDFEPGEPFGSKHGHSRTALHKTKASLLWNANNGACTVQSERGLDPVSVTGNIRGIAYQFEGSALFFRFDCANHQTLLTWLHSLHGLIPSFLGLTLIDVPIIKFCRGKVGETPFRWEMIETRSSMHVTDTNNQDRLLRQSMDAYAHMGQTKNLRFIASLNYFVRACRLIVAGNGPWEFMAETVLNFAKCLEVLVVARSEDEGSRDKVRAGLKAIGVDAGKIEGVFVPILILRNSFDVGHGRIASLNNAADLQLIYELLWDAEGEFRKLLQFVASGLIGGTITLPKHEVDNDYAKPVQGLIDKQRAKQGVGTNAQ